MTMKISEDGQRELDRKSALDTIERVGGKLWGIAALIKGRESDDDVTLDIGAAEGIAEILQDFNCEICDAVEILRGEGVQS